MSARPRANLSRRKSGKRGPLLLAKIAHGPKTALERVSSGRKVIRASAVRLEAACAPRVPHGTAARAAVSLGAAWPHAASVSARLAAVRSVTARKTAATTRRIVAIAARPTKTAPTTASLVIGAFGPLGRFALGRASRGQFDADSRALPQSVVQAGDGCFGAVRVLHVDEAKVLEYVALDYFAVLFEELLEFGAARRRRYVADVDLDWGGHVSHLGSSFFFLFFFFKFLRFRRRFREEEKDSVRFGSDWISRGATNIIRINVDLYRVYCK